jgi:spore coat polysaccharide biosynthesis protein SpsF
MIDPRLIKDTASYYFLTGADYCATRMNPTAYPDGMDVEIFNFNSLMFAIDGQTSKHNLEHVTPAIKETPFHNCENLPSKECYSEEIRLSLDTLEDYKLIRRIYRELYPKNPLFGLKEIMEVLEECQRDVK